MRTKICILPLAASVLALVSCKTYPMFAFSDSSYTFGVVFDGVNIEGCEVGQKGQLLIGGGILCEGFEEIVIPDNLVAGDTLIINFRGTLGIRETYPASIFLDGTLKSYEFKRTHTIQMEVGELKNQSSLLYSKSLILNKELEYEESVFDVKNEDDLVWVTVDIEATERNCPKCPPDANCSPCALYYAAVYDFDPFAHLYN